MEYSFQTKPFDHQLAAFQTSRDLTDYAIFWEPGCGKTKPCIDNVADLYERGKVDALLVVAPSGVHRNWVTDEIPTHLPDRLRDDTECLFWRSNKAGTKWFQKKQAELLTYPGLAVLAMSYEAFTTKRAKSFLWKFLQRRKVFYVLDEAHNIKTPSAKRTKSVVASAVYASYRRILTGTPVAETPFDVYSQVRFLRPSFWRDRGIGTFSAFKTRYADWLTAAEVKQMEGYDPGYDKLIGYKNLDELSGYVDDLGDRLLKDDVTDLPPKLYSRRPFEMTTEQRRVYDDLKEDLIAELAGGQTVEATLPIVMLLRLQQIACGYVVPEAGADPVDIEGGDARLRALMQTVEPLPHPCIVWARFRNDVDKIMNALADAKIAAVRYDGAVDEDGRAASKEAFQKGDANVFVGNPAAGAEGLTLVRARTVVYYSNSFRLVHRLQSEDRAHRIGQEHPVHYVDLVAEDTVDEKIIRALRSKFDIASALTGDGLREWLQ